MADVPSSADRADDRTDATSGGPIRELGRRRLLRLSPAVAIGSGCLGSPADPATATESTSETATVDDAELNGPRIGLISDTHYHVGGGLREPDIPETERIEENTRAVLEAMNEWGAEAIVHLGDILNGAHHTGTSQSTWEEWQQQYMQLIHDTADLPAEDIHWVLGNHEYKKAGSWDMGSVYENFYGESALSATWYSTTYDGFDIVVMNNSYRDRDQGGARGLMDVPDPEVEWFKSQLEASDRPKLVFMHHPVVVVSGLTYDVVNLEDVNAPSENAETVRQLIEEDPTVMGTFFGHLHHERIWDKIFENRPGHYHVCGPHEFMASNEVYAFGKLALGEREGEAIGTLTADYQGTTDWRTSWTLPSTSEYDPSPYLFEDWGRNQFTEPWREGPVSGRSGSALNRPDWESFGGATPTTGDGTLSHSGDAAAELGVELDRTVGRWSYWFRFETLGEGDGRFEFPFIADDAGNELDLVVTTGGTGQFSLEKRADGTTDPLGQQRWPADTDWHSITVVRDEGGYLEAFMDVYSTGQEIPSHGSVVSLREPWLPEAIYTKLRLVPNGGETRTTLGRAEHSEWATWA